MKELRPNKQLLLNLRGVCLMVFLMLSTHAFNQVDGDKDINIDNIDDLTLVKVDPIDEEPVTGIFNKILQFFKFKENKRLKDSIRIRSHIVDLVEKSKLKVDTTALNILINQIREELKTDQVLLDSASVDIASNEKKIADSELLLSALKVQLSGVVQDAIEENSAAKKSLKEVMASDLVAIKDVKFSCVSGKSAIDTEEIGKNKDTIVRSRRCLFPKKKIIGWHNQWNTEEYKNYNYNYLSVLNLFGYELDPDGTPGNLNHLNNYRLEGGVIDYAHANNTNVHLTIYNKKNAEIRDFLRNPISINRFEEYVIEYVKDSGLKGIVIYFEDISPNDADLFVKFIRDLREQLYMKAGSIELNIVIPAIVDDDSTRKISAYNFAALDPLVDYYILRTDEMTKTWSRIAKGRSALFNSNKFGNMSIENTVSYYTNGKISPEKLIMMISYHGLSWEVTDFNGEVKEGHYGSNIKYNEIIKQYFNSKSENTVVVGGYDPDLATSYLNITRQYDDLERPDSYTQIWYEDNLSLFDKYNWALDNNLGGVSIRNLGYDDPHPELWDVLAASMIEIKRTEVDTIIIPPVVIPSKWTIFKNDMQWASLGVLKYRSTDTTKIVEINNKPISLLKNCENSVITSHYRPFSDNNIDWLWSTFQLYDDKKERKKDYDEFLLARGDVDSSVEDAPRHLRDLETCTCLMGRWEFYSYWLFFIALVSTLLLVVAKLVYNHLQRLKLGSNTVHLVLKIAQIVLLILALTTLLFGIFLAPWIDEIGASNDGNIGLDVILITTFFGIVLGWIIRNSIMRGKLVKPNQP